MSTSCSLGNWGDVPRWLLCHPGTRLFPSWLELPTVHQAFTDFHNAPVCLVLRHVQCLATLAPSALPRILGSRQSGNHHHHFANEEGAQRLLRLGWAPTARPGLALGPLSPLVSFLTESPALQKAIAVVLCGPRADLQFPTETLGLNCGPARVHTLVCTHTHTHTHTTETKVLKSET